MSSIKHDFFKVVHEKKIYDQIHLGMFHSVFIILITTMHISLLKALRSPAEIQQVWEIRKAACIISL